MPTLRTWQVAHPSVWTQAQREAYAHDVCLSVAAAMAHALPEIGPGNGVGLLLAVVRNIVAVNPDIADASMDALLDCASDIGKMHPAPEGRVVN